MNPYCIRWTTRWQTLYLFKHGQDRQIGWTHDKKEAYTFIKENAETFVNTLSSYDFYNGALEAVTYE